MGQSPHWYANSRSASQEIPVLLQNSNIHYRVLKSPSLFPVLRQLSPVHTLTPRFFYIRFNIILHKNQY